MQTHIQRPGGLAMQFSQLCSLPICQVSDCEQFRQLLECPTVDKITLLSSIPSPKTPSNRPLHLLYLCLKELPGPWPTIPLLQCHERLTRNLSDASTSVEDGDINDWLLRATEHLIKQSCSSMAGLLWRDEAPAIRSPQLQTSITHSQLADFVANFALPVDARAVKPVIAMILPDGPFLAAVCLAVATYYTALPLDSTLRTHELRDNLGHAGASVILTTAEQYENHRLGAYDIGNANCKVLIVELSSNDVFELGHLGGLLAAGTGSIQPPPNRADDVALLQISKGPSGARKIAAVTTYSVIEQAVCVVASCGLVADDTCLGMLSLHHVEHLISNFIAPICCGGSTICCSAFDGDLFWDVFERASPTWCSASPAMYCVILAKAPYPSESRSRRDKMRLVSSAGPGFSLALECRLRDTFRCEAKQSALSLAFKSLASQQNGAADRQTAGRVRVCDRGQPLPLDYEDPGGSPGESTTRNHEHQRNSKAAGPDYLGDDGYLFVMGRAKETIRRGTELISPFEVEAAIVTAAKSPSSPISGKISGILAFAVAHETLQESVAVVLVPKPGVPRIDLKTLYRAIKPCLGPSKWPALIVYMDHLPQKDGRPVRQMLAKRLGLPVLSNDTPYISRHWEAKCPPATNSLHLVFDSSECEVDRAEVTTAMGPVIPRGQQICLRFDPKEGFLEAFLAPKSIDTEPLTQDWIIHVQRLLSFSIHNYMIPQKLHILAEPFPEDPLGRVDQDGLEMMLRSAKRSLGSKQTPSTEMRVAKAFAKALGCKVSKLDPTVDFFSIGGDSVAATKLLSNLHAEFNVRVPAGLVLNQGTVRALTTYLEAATQLGPLDKTGEAEQSCAERKSSTNLFLMLLQLLPLAVFYPIRRGTQWTIFLCFLSYTRFWTTNAVVYGRLANLVLSIVVAYIAVQTVAPFIGIASKWIIIGRYREGLYPMWGSYHTRWWLVQKIVLLAGAGFFNNTEYSKALYCRLMGAKIGKNVKLRGARLGEWDLLEIGDGVDMSHSSCRPFGVEKNTSMLLRRIVIGENTSVGANSVIAPGADIPPYIRIGFSSSSWELREASETNIGPLVKSPLKPHWALSAFLTFPLYALGWLITLLPWLGGLSRLVAEKPLVSNVPLRDMMEWFSMDPKVGFHYLPLILRAIISPYLMFCYTALVRVLLDCILGEMQPGPIGGRSNLDKWRAELTKALLPDKRFQEFTEMFGQHGEATSVAVRMLGGKVGKRVCWPDITPNVNDYRLLDIGDGVTIGNRSKLITSDGSGWEKVWIRNGAILEDDVCLLPGVEVGERTTMGSGTLTRRNATYPPGGMYIGSRGGDAVCVTTGRHELGSKLTVPNRIHHMTSHGTLKPSQYLRHVGSSDTLVGTSKASSLHDKDEDSVKEKPAKEDCGAGLEVQERSFPAKAQRVLRAVGLFFYSSFMAVFTAFYWNVPVICSVKLVGRTFHDRFELMDSTYDTMVLYTLLCTTMCILMTLQSILALAVVVGAKWLLLGRTSPGRHGGNCSSYRRRRQIFLTIERLVHRCYRNKGIVGVLAGTHWLVMYYRALGAKIGKDCALFANGRVGASFTEPDMIVMGDRVAVDDAAIVAHRGFYNHIDLDPVDIGDGCILRAGSSVLGGATMMRESCLMEHTLLLAGDVVGTGDAMQGSPARPFRGKRLRGLRRERWAAEASRNNSDATLIAEEGVEDKGMTEIRGFK